MALSGSCEQVHPGEIYQRSMALGSPSMIASLVGVATECGIESTHLCCAYSTMQEPSTTTCGSLMAAACVHRAQQREPQCRATQLSRRIMRWADPEAGLARSCIWLWTRTAFQSQSPSAQGNGTRVGGSSKRPAARGELMGRSAPARRRPHRLGADKAYSLRWIRSWLRSKKIHAVIPTRKDQPTLTTFDRAAYRTRNVIERCIGWLNEARRVATRHEKLARNYLGMIKLAILHRTLRVLSAGSVPDVS